MMKPLCLKEYLLFTAVVFTLMGVMFTVYCLLLGIHPLSLDVVSCPLFYLLLGFIIWMVYIVLYHYNKLTKILLCFVLILLLYIFYMFYKNYLYY